MRFRKKSAYDEARDTLLAAMQAMGPATEAYSNYLKQLDKLSELKMREQNNHVSMDTVAIVVGNLVGILIIVAYEQKHVLGSRGMNFILKPKTPE